MLRARDISENNIEVQMTETSPLQSLPPTNTTLPKSSSSIKSLALPAKCDCPTDKSERCCCSNDETRSTALNPGLVDSWTVMLEGLRAREYPQLKDRTYLDHGGTTLYARSLVDEFAADLIASLYGNPHSTSSPSASAGRRINQVRERVLRFFNTDPDQFDIVFVANATAAMKLVFDCFCDYAAVTNKSIWYGYHKDAHTSLVGIRGMTKMHRCFATDDEVDLWISTGGRGGARLRQLGLFAYPGQSNMTGRRLPLSWPGRIRNSSHKAEIYTLLDAAALVGTTPLDLSDSATAPDFVALSFYKIFGFPNLGALIVRKQSKQVLERRVYFGGGTVDIVTSMSNPWHAKKESSLHDRLEDGTLPFHSIFALDHAINVHKRLYGPNPMDLICMHTAQLGRQLYEGLSRLRHHNGTPVVRIYKDDNAVYGDPSLQAATIAFNVQRADGSLVGFGDVEEAADRQNIYVRSGALCNPGGVATYLKWSSSELKAAYAAGHRCSKPVQMIDGKATGLVRVSLGAMSTLSDVNTFLRFLDEIYLDRSPSIKSAAVHSSHLVSVAEKSLTSSSTPSSFRQDSSPKIQHSPFIPPLSLGAALKLEMTATAPDPGLNEYGASTALTQVLDIEPKKLKNGPFIPPECFHLHGPWEGNREQHAHLNTEIKVCKLQDNRVTSRNPTRNMKIRNIGRSLVNLLQTRSHFHGSRYEQP